ncbi:caspase family protein [Microcoleus sp. w2-18bC1]
MSKSKHDFHRNIAIIIGINDYSNEVPRLETAVPDAEEFARLMQERYQYEVHLLLNEDATLNKLKQLIDCFSNKKIPFGKNPEINDKDRIILYFAGHGKALDAKEKQEGPVGYLIPQDATDNPDTYLKMQDLHDALLKLPCRHLLIILDCCFSGAFYWSSINRDVVPKVKLYKQVYDHYIKYRAWQVITSTSDKQTAIDSPPRGKVVVGSKVHSPFAKHLFDVLKKNDDYEGGIITANDLYRFLRKAVAVETEEYKAQTPGICPLKLHENGEYLFLLQSEPNLEDAPPLRLKDSPYRGLESYQEKHKDLYFGRKEQIEQLYEKVNNFNNRSLTIVLGASGTGKSSLVAAGLIPYLEEKRKSLQKWHILKEPIRLGEFPLIALKNSLSQQLNFIDPNPDSEETQQADKSTWFSKILNYVFGRKEVNPTKPQQSLEEEVKLLSDRLKNWFDKNSYGTLMLAIDQFEELITLQPRPEQKEQKKKQKKKGQPEKTQQELVLIWLKDSLDFYKDRLRIVLTIRSDFEVQFQDKDLKDYWTEKARFHIKEMTTAELREAITEPASKNSIFFVPNTLIDTLVDEVAGMPGTLPLLSFTLNELYRIFAESVNEGERDDRAIIRKDYDKLGGVARSLTQRAEKEYEKLVKREQVYQYLRKIVIFNDPLISQKYSRIFQWLFWASFAYEQTICRVMLRMVAVGSGELARRRVLESELEYSEPENTRRKKVVDEFVNARLLVKYTEDGQTYVEPAHDVLVRGWDRLLKWKQEEEKKGNLILQRQLTPAAVEWKFERSKSNRYLWDNHPRLNWLKKELKSSQNWFNQLDAEFVNCSINEKYRKNFLIILLSGVIGIGFFSLIAISLRNKEISGIRTSTDAAKAKLSQQNDLEALIELLQASKNIDNSSSSWTQWIALLEQNQAIKNLDSQLNSSLKFSPLNLIGVYQQDEAMIANAQLRATLLKAVYVAKERNRLRLDRGSIYRVAFHPTKDLLATVGERDVVRLWDSSGKQIDLLLTGQGEQNVEVYSVAFSNDGKFLATGDNQGKVKLWEIKDDNTVKSQPMQTIPLDVESKPTQTIAADTDKKNSSIVRDISFSPDNKFLAIIKKEATTEATVEFFKKEKNGQFKPKDISNSQLGQQKNIWDLEFSRKESPVQLATLNPNNTVSLWSISSSEKDNTLSFDKISSAQEKNHFNSIAFSVDNNLVTGGYGNIENEKNENFDSKYLCENDSQVRLEDKKCEFQSQQREIYELAFSKDGKLATVGADDTVRIWKSGTEIDKIQPPEERTEQVQAQSIAISPNGQLLATVRGDDSVTLWNVSGDAIRRFRTEGGKINSVAFSPNNELLAISTEQGNVSLWNTQGKKLDEIQRKKDDKGQSIKNVIFHQENNVLKLITIPEKGTIFVYNLEDKKFKKNKGEYDRTEQSKLSDLKSLAYSPTKKLVATIGTDGTFKLWNYPDFTTIQNVPGQFSSVAFSHNGKWLVTGDKNGTVKRWEIKENSQGLTLYDEFSTGKTSLNDVAFYPLNSYRIFTAGDDGTVREWDLSSNRQLPSSAKNKEENVKKQVFSPDGKLLATLDEEKQLNLWQIPDNGTFSEKKEISKADIFKSKSFESVIFSPDSKFIVTAINQDGKNQIVLGNIEGQEVKQLDKQPLDKQPLEKNQNIKSLDFSKDNKLLAITGDNKIKLWQIKNKKLEVLDVLPEELKKKSIALARFTHDGKKIATVEVTKDKNSENKNKNSKNVELWQISSDDSLWQKIYCHLPWSKCPQPNPLITVIPTEQESVESLGFSRNGQKLAIGGSDGTFKLWTIKTKEFKKFTIKQNQQAKIYQIQFSKDGELIASIETDPNTGNNTDPKTANNNVILWDLEGNQLRTIALPGASVKSVFFTEDSKRLLVADNQGKTIFFEVDLKELRKKSCQLVQDYLTYNSDLNINETKKLCPSTKGDSSSNRYVDDKVSGGEKVLLTKINNSYEKEEGIEYFEQGDFELAELLFDYYLLENKNDPEARIYLNNARIGEQSSHTIAVSVPISSDVNGSLEILRGVAQAQNDYNNWAKTQQGIIPIRVLIADDRNDPKVAKKIATNLADNSDVLGVVGHFSSSVTREAATVYNDKGLVTISPISTSVKLSEVMGKDKYIFRTVPNDKVAAQELANYTLNSLKKQKAVLFYNSQSEYSQSLSSEFKSAFASKGGQGLKENEVDLFNQSFDPTKILEKIDENTALVFLADNSKLNQLFEVVKANNGKSPILAGDDVYGPQVLEFFHKQKLPNPKGLFVAIPWHIGNNPSLQFSSLSKGLWGDRDVNWRTVTAYDAAKALIAAIKQNPDRKEIAKILHSNTFHAQGAVEPVQFLPSGDRDGNIIELVKIVKPTSKSRSGYDYEFVPVENQTRSNYVTKPKTSK